MGRMLLAGLLVLIGYDVAIGQARLGPIDEYSKDNVNASSPPAAAVPASVTSGLESVVRTSPYSATSVWIPAASPAAKDPPVGVPDFTGRPTASGADSLWRPAAPPTTFWAEADYLLWRVKGDSLPALVTTSPPGTPQAGAGVAGTPGVLTLFGGSGVNDDFRSGGRIRVGSWLDCNQTLGVEASFFMLANSSSGFDAASSGNPILARPFLNTMTGMPDAELVAFPGIVTGAVSARETSELLGAGIWLRHNLCCGCCYRVDALLGYRYLRLTDRLGIGESLVSTDPNSPTIPLGTRFSVLDQFDTTNNFHGADLGLAGEFRRGPWVFEWVAKVALGGNGGGVDIGGVPTVTVPGFAPTVNPGGLLALSSNSGHFDVNRFSVVPEVGVKVAYQVTPRVRVFAGYDFLYWTNVVRPGGQIDTAVNPMLLPPVTPPIAGPIRPAPLLATSDIWVHGISVGLEFRY